MTFFLNRITAVVTFLVGAIFLLMAVQVEATNDDPIGPGKVAVALASLIILFSIVLALGPKTAAEIGEATEIQNGRRTAHVFFTLIVAGLICTFFFEALGYFPIVFVMLCVLLFAFGNRKPLKLFAISLLGALGYYLIFVKILGMRDPRDFFAEFF